MLITLADELAFPLLNPLHFNADSLNISHLTKGAVSAGGAGFLAE